MSGWILWLLLAFGFGAGELLTSGFFLAPFAFGGLGATVVDAAGAGEPVSLIVFAVVSIAALATVRPMVQSRLTAGPTLRTGGAALIGKHAIVLERISNHEAVGCVRIEGEVWTARTLDDDREIPVGAHVEVVDIRGATALVIE
jgi:membrane protein implicated in regulation of membrane protease activity